MKTKAADNQYWPPNLKEMLESVTQKIADLQHEEKTIRRMIAYEKKRMKQPGGWGDAPIPWDRFQY